MGGAPLVLERVQPVKDGEGDLYGQLLGDRVQSGAERLEQLRFLENGIDIQVTHVSGAELSVDTPEDLARARTIWNRTVQACSPPLPIESPLTD